MGLRSLQLRDSYRSGRDQLAKDFFVPCLTQSRSYSRAVGYFTAGSLGLVAPGLRELVANGGVIRIVASPHLREEDVAQIRLGYQIRDVIDMAISRELDAATESDRRRLGLLGRLIADGKLDIKIAFANLNGQIGLYHEKIGIFQDENNDAVSFVGSMNETVQAHISNLESFEVFRGWAPEDARRVAQHVRDFEALWNDDTPFVEIYDLPDLALEHLKRLALKVTDAYQSPDPETLEPLLAASTGGYGEPRIPRKVELRSYQREAVGAWFDNDGQGTFKMATGTGKTYTALAAMTQLFRHHQQHTRPLLTVVVCPYQNLVDQWAADLRMFGCQPIWCYESYTSWAPTVERLIGPLTSGSVPYLALVTTVATFRGAPFQALLSKVNAPTLLIADEVHNMGAESVRKALPENVRYRLALSATPERWFDDAGTKALFDYFGPTVFELTLGDAIKMGALSEYRYTPIPVLLDDDETNLYAELTSKIGRLLTSNAEPSDDDADSILGQLLRKRAAVLAHASNKLAAFEHEVRQRSSKWHQLVYCGEGTPPTREGDRSQVDSVVDLLGNQLRMTVDRYVSDTPVAERRQILERFGSEKDLQFVVSMRCLDEGVDLPEARVAYLLASSSNPRQFIQRRGRILRLPKDGSRKVAEIVDFIAIPNGSPLAAAAETERNLLKRELQRVLDFASLAINGPEATAALLDVRRRYHLLDL